MLLEYSGVWRFEWKSGGECPLGLQKIQCQFGDRACKQIKKSGGFCVVWSLLFVKTQLENPDKNAKDIERYILHSMDKDPRKLYIFIRNYSQFLLDNIKKLNDELKIGEFIKSHSTTSRGLRYLEKNL